MELDQFFSVNQAMGEYPIANLLLQSFQSTLKQAGVWQKATSEPLCHKPGFHQRPLLGSIEFGIQAAYHLRRKTGVDIVLPIAICDVGKAQQFIRYCRDKHAGHYQGSAKIAARLAYTAGLNNVDDLLLIFASRLGSHLTEKTVTDLLNTPRLKYVSQLLDLKEDKTLLTGNSRDVQWLTRLLSILGCRALGRGWAEKHRTERHRLASRVKTLGQQYRLDPAFCEILIGDIITSQH